MPFRCGSSVPGSVDERVAVAGDHRLELLQVRFGGLGQLRALIGDPSDKHRLIGVERHGDDLLVVEIAVVDAGAHRVAVQADDRSR